MSTPTPGQQRHLARPKLTIPDELNRLITWHQSRECIPTHTEACLDLMRRGLRSVGLMGGQHGKA
jgi:hypothetical protein